MRSLGFFEWVVIDNCNLRCSYCVNKGEYSHKSKAQMIYVPEREISVAQKIVEVSDEFERMIVNLTGGEPTLAPRLDEAIRILAGAGNIEIRLITNLRAVERFRQIAPYLSLAYVSLHVALRDEQEIDAIIAAINDTKGSLQIFLTQVDFGLTKEDYLKLAKIQKQTGMKIEFQRFIPPWTEDGKLDDAEKISAESFRNSFGKRCALGYFYFLIEADGTLKYDLWCSDRKADKQVSLVENGFPGIGKYILDDMKKCPRQSCGCNYNYFFYDLYKKECRLKGYASSEVFGRYNIRIAAKLKQIFSSIKSRLR